MKCLYVSLLCLYCIITNISFRRSHSSVCLNQQCQLCHVKLWAAGTDACLQLAAQAVPTSPQCKKLLWSQPCSTSLSSSQHQSLLPIPLGATDPISFSVICEWEFEGNLESVPGWSKRGILNKQKLYLERVKYYLSRNYALSEWSRCGPARPSIH